MTARLIVIDGIDGCGKSTQMRMLTEVLHEDHVLFSREPGGSSYAEKIRNVILDAEGKNTTPLARMLLFWAARDDHIRNLIEPSLQKGRHVIVDRFDSSTFALQIYGDQAREFTAAFLSFRRHIVERLNPAYIMLDLDPETAIRRMGDDTMRTANYLDQRPIDFHTRVRQGFHDFARYAPCTFIDADRPPEAVHQDIVKTLRALGVRP